MTSATWRFVAASMVAAAVGLASSLGIAAEKPIVFAAASLKNALDDVNAEWKAETGKEATISYAASSALARQIEAGAPADVFVSADLDWMEYLSERDLTKKDTETRLLGNRIVLIAPAGAGTKVEIAPWFDLAGLLGDGRLAMANVDSVPAGKYGKAALEALGAWPGVADRLAQAENVRAALLLVATGEAPLGIVYATDANSETKVEVVGAFPENTHPPIVYPAALTAQSENPDAAEFLRFMQTDAARAVFENQGFAVLTPPASN